jgi:hypothetical protein
MQFTSKKNSFRSMENGKWIMKNGPTDLPHTGASRNGGIGFSIGKSIQKDKEMSNFKWQIANMGQAERRLWDGQETDPQGQEIGLSNCKDRKTNEKSEGREIGE